MAAARLPGIYFESVPAPAPMLFPCMDVAAFAGFLASGPVGVPFAVEDPDRFQDVFGTDLTLAWDGNLRQMRMAQAAPAVRTFFRNGGRRCWVLRLAEGALSNAWIVPGLLQLDQAETFHAGWALARSEGSWSDDLTVNATLLESPLAVQPAGWPGTEALPQPPTVGLDRGDLVQFLFPGSGTLAYFDYSSSQWFWFEPVTSAAASQPAATPDSVFYLDAGTDAAVPFTSFTVQPVTGELVLGVTRAEGLSIPPGSWLRMKFGARTLLLQVEGTAAGQNAYGSPPADEMATLTSTRAWWVADPGTAWAAHKLQAFQASIVTFQLWAFPQNASAQQVAGLGFSPDSPQYWGLLPTDTVLYSPASQPATPLPYAALAGEIDYPRFALAGPTSTGLGLPLGMTALVNPDFTQGATQPGATALDRDGLASFSPALFLDPELTPGPGGPSSGTLLQEAYYLQYQAQNPRPLSGVHALLGIDEISMIAVPDAVHSGWAPAPAETGVLGSPDPVTVSAQDESGGYTVSWTAVPGASGYTVDQSTDPSFASAVTSLDAGTGLSMSLSSNSQCPVELYYRVSASGIAGDGPWSRSAHVELGTGDFTAYAAAQLLAPQVTLIEEKPNRILLQWTTAAAETFTLQIAGDPLFESGYTLYQGTESSFEYWVTPGPPSYFRVSAQAAAQASPWSNTVNTTPEPPSPWEVVHFPASNPPFTAFSAPPVLAAVHQALLVMAAARGDMVAILSLPYSFRQGQALAYQAALLNSPPIANDPMPTLPSYGALYHPWIVTPDTTSAAPLSLRSLVPDGAVCGVMAATTLKSGAWIAPANVAVSNAVAVAPVLETGAAQAFAAAGINLIAQQPEGFLITGQDTLASGDYADLQPLNVRRLLILLRRLALREGVRYVFQNISASFQRTVTRQFQQWMQMLLARGAFAGASAADSYQVIADATVNSQTSIDQGRWVVKLLVAPSVPMRFLTVKLVQSGGQLSLVEG